jgi:hypothetical protein
VREALDPSLDLEHPDQALVNYALAVRQKGYDVPLVTDDTICSVTAENVDLPVLDLPQHWLREPEADESSKEIIRLRGEISRLYAAEPKAQVNFLDSTFKPLTRLEASVTGWPALSETEIDALMTEVQRRCPQATSFERQKPSRLLKKSFSTRSESDLIAIIEG